MSSHAPPEEKKKLKAWLARKRVMRNIVIQQHVQQTEAEVRRQEMAKAALAPKRQEEEKDDVIWSAKTQEYRNKLTDKKRMARERWNRMAGTDEAGGRGL